VFESLSLLIFAPPTTVDYQKDGRRLEKETNRRYDLQKEQKAKAKEDKAKAAGTAEKKKKKEDEEDDEEDDDEGDDDEDEKNSDSDPDVEFSDCGVRTEYRPTAMLEMLLADGPLGLLVTTCCTGPDAAQVRKKNLR
jgi:hypothetical protein